MPALLPNSKIGSDDVTQGIISTLAFFSLYEIPLPARRIFELLYRTKSTEQEVRQKLDELAGKKKIYRTDVGYSLKPLDPEKYKINQVELKKRWLIVDRYFWILSTLPFVEQLSIINSLAIGNAHQESDIDFFVVTKPNRLYFVRSLIIVLFKLLGIYKTKTETKDRFCFGFYVTKDAEDLSAVLIQGGDPLFAFWFASFAPIFESGAYARLVQDNRWIAEYFPNFKAQDRLFHIRRQRLAGRIVKKFLEIILYIIAVPLEPILRGIHIRHTFKLPENHWETSTTVATARMLKLHALDPRTEIKRKFLELLQTLR
jgi:hypothetical protein